jgi:hypothetical protein
MKKTTTSLFILLTLSTLCVKGFSQKQNPDFIGGPTESVSTDGKTANATAVDEVKSRSTKASLDQDTSKSGIKPAGATDAKTTAAPNGIPNRMAEAKGEKAKVEKAKAKVAKDVENHNGSSHVGGHK